MPYKHNGNGGNGGNWDNGDSDKEVPYYRGSPTIVRRYVNKHNGERYIAW
jgi:hypothetical protein